MQGRSAEAVRTFIARTKESGGIPPPPEVLTPLTDAALPLLQGLHRL